MTKKPDKDQIIDDVETQLDEAQELVDNVEDDVSDHKQEELAWLRTELEQQQKALKNLTDNLATNQSALLEQLQARQLEITDMLQKILASPSVSEAPKKEELPPRKSVKDEPPKPHDTTETQTPKTHRVLL